MIVPMQLKSLLAVARKIYCAECVRVGVFFVLPGRGHLCPWIMNLVCTLGCRRENERERVRGEWENSVEVANNWCVYDNGVILFLNI